MPYILTKVVAGITTEIMKSYSGRYGTKIINAPKEKESPEKLKNYQDKVAERKCRWLINTNFKFGDLWMTLTYPAWTRPTSEKARKDIDKFLKNCRRYYKRAGQIFKYIMTAGRTSRGAVHFHFVINKFDLEKISSIWWSIAGNEKTPCPKVDYRVLDNTGQYNKIAAYLIKNSKETFWSEDRIHSKHFCASKNLEQPTITKEIIGASAWRKEPKAPKGYYIDKNTIHNGINEMGYQCQHYTLVKINNHYILCYYCIVIFFSTV